MTDVRLFHTSDGGNIQFASDDLETDLALDAGLETAAYLSLLGGNDRDPGTLRAGGTGERPDRYQWWGNIGAPASEKLRSETQAILRTLVPTSANLRKLEDAIGRDLDWFVKDKIASSASGTAALSVSDTGQSIVHLDVRIIIQKKEYAFVFTAAWEGS